VLKDHCNDHTVTGESILVKHNDFRHDNVCSPKSNQKHSRKHVRRGNRKNRSRTNGNIKTKGTPIKVNIAFNNVNRVKSKLYDIRKLIVEQNIDIFGIDETFLENEECINVNGFNWYGKNRIGKGGGGIGMLVSDKIVVVDDNICNSTSDNLERLWIRVKISGIFINICVAYFPVEGADPDLTDELYNQLLSEIIQLEEECNINNENPKILIMGDFNGRIGNKIYGGDPILNSNGERLLNFCNDASLDIVNCSRKTEGKITWVRHSQSSCIDYFLSSNVLDDYIEKMIVDDERNFHLGSDHNVLFLRLKFNPCEDTNPDVGLGCKTWNISHDQDWSAYHKSISEQFDQWDAANFNDANSLWYSWKQKLISIALDTIGYKKPGKNGKQWWDKSIDKAIKDRKQACKEHRRWCKDDDQDKERGDALWEDYKLKKMHAKNLIQQKITQMRFERSFKIAQAGGPSSRDFWKELRGKKKKDSFNSLQIPNSNEITTDKKVMKSSIMNYWNTLGKMNRELNCNDTIIKSHVSNVRRGFNDFNIDVPNVLNDMLFSFENVKDSICRSKNNSAPGFDTITNELLKNGNDDLIHTLTNMFNRFLLLESTPEEWNQGIIVPIFKKGNKNDLNNYRGITLTSCVSKIFNRLVCDRISVFIESNDILTEVQGGFRKDHRCEDHIFTLKSIIATRSAENKSTYLAFLDFRKAFDTVWREGLLSIAWNIGIRGKVWNILDNLYKNVQCNVKLGDIETDLFDIDEGLKQGCVLSPILFCIYINELTKMLRNESVGVNVFDVNINCLFWADDVVLIAENESDLQKMLNIASIFSERWKLDFNHSKSNVVVVGKRKDENKIWNLGSSRINEVDNYKYLGFNISRTLSDHAHANDLIKKGNRLIGYIKSIINSHDNFNRVYYGNILWKTLALPAINYACAVSSYSASDYKRLENLQLQMARSILKAPRCTPSVTLLGDLGWDTIENSHKVCKVKYFDRLTNMDPHRWPKLLFNAIFTIHNYNRHLRWNWIGCIDNSLNDNGFGHIFKSVYNLHNHASWVRSFQNAHRDHYNSNWYNTACSKSSLIDYVCFKNQPYLENYLLDKLDFYGVSLKFKARSNTLPLNGRVASWHNSTTSGFCDLCSNGDVEDIRHFIFSCQLLNDIRVDEFNKLKQSLHKEGLSCVWVLFNTSNINVRLCILLGGDWTQYLQHILPINDVHNAHVCFDVTCKSLLKRLWKARNNFLN